MRAIFRFAPSSRLFLLFTNLAAVALFSLAGCGGNTSTSSGTTSGTTTTGASSSTPAGNVSGGANLGLVWNSTDKTLRPVIGVPGSSWLGASIVAAGAYTSGSYSASSGVALLTDAHGNLSLITPTSQQPAVLAQGAPAGANIVFSPKGQHAAIFAPNANSAMLVSGLTGQPVVSTISGTGAIAAMAISDDGTVLIASPGTTGVSLSEIPSSGVRSNPASLAGFGGMTFLPGSDDFLLADSANNTLVRSHNGNLQTLATHADGLNQPVDVAVSADGQWAVTANSADGTLVRVNLTGTATPLRALCACSPTELLPLAGNAVFQLTQPGTSPSWIIDAGRATPGVFFIPPTTASTESNK